MYPYTGTNQHPNSGYPGASLGGGPSPYYPPPMGSTTVYTTTTTGYPAPNPYHSQPMMHTTQYARLPGMITMNPYLSIPSIYNRVFYNWYGPYQDPRMPFQPPMGIPHHIVQLFMEASCVFRNYDRDFSGTLEFHEFQNAMFHLGYRVDPYQLQSLFFMIDKDRSGRLSEREFCEFWVYSQQSHIPGFGYWH